MHLQGRVILMLREPVLRGWRLLSEPDTVMVGEDKARVWQPASCPAPDPGALEALAPKPHPSPPPPFPSRTDAPPPTALPKPKF